MNRKEKMVLFLMVVLFLGSVGIFGYQHFYLEKAPVYDEVKVLVATKDIEVNDALGGENTHWKLIDRKYLTESMVTEDVQLSGIVALTEILSGETVHVHRLGEELVPDVSFYEVNIEPHYSSTIRSNDLIRVYVQIMDKDTLMIENYLLFDHKRVVSLPENDPQQSSLRQETHITITLTDSEAIRYFDALQLGNIIAMKYDNVAETDKEIPLFNAQEWAQARREMNAE